MKKTTILLLLFAARVAAADDADVARGFENLRNVIAAAQLLEFYAWTGTVPQIAPFADPWGTQYRIDVEKGRIVGAGSDKVFNEASWAENAQFSGLEGDVVFQSGKIWRSNRNWLYGNVTVGAKSDAELAALRSAEVVFMTMRTPEMQKITALRVSRLGMANLSGLASQHLKTHGNFAKLAAASDPAATLVADANGNPRLFRDGWGEPLRVVVTDHHYRIISAGADRTFDEESWSRPTTTDPAEDMVVEDDVFVRAVDMSALLKDSARKRIEPFSQPPDPKVEHDPKWRRVGGVVKAPVPVERIQAVYPEHYRQMRLSGTVIVETEITESGVVAGVCLLQSVAPDFDTAVMDAARGWKFEPATMNGQPVPVLFNLTVKFELK